MSSADHPHPAMLVTTDASECPEVPGGAVVSIGAYDGVHLGHLAVIHEVRRLAAERGCASAVVTFDPHPATVVRPESAPKLLTDADQKLEQLALAGLDRTHVVRFDEARSKESAADFVREVLVDCLHARAVVVGHDFHFGHQREGTVGFLASMGGELGFDVLGLRLTADDGEAVSSTRIRSLLIEGEVEAAARLLGRPYELRGEVVHGDHRGRTLGFPTANVNVAGDRQLPADGIYAGWYVHPDGRRQGAAVCLGRRPQFYENAGTRLLEAHVLDFDGDLYGQPGRVQFVDRLRGEARFESVDALVAQMRRDVENTRRILDL